VAGHQAERESSSKIEARHEEEAAAKSATLIIRAKEIPERAKELKGEARR